MNNGLTHFNSKGRVAQVHVGRKSVTQRKAVAYGEVTAVSQAIRALRRNQLKKGDALAAAKIAGILAAKSTASFIPLCHSVALDCVDIAFRIRPGKIEIRAVAEATGKTGVEMEALTAVSMACLTLYDMMKALDKSIVIGPIYLLEKTGGRSGLYRREGDKSDKGHKGDKGIGVLVNGG